VPSAMMEVNQDNLEENARNEMEKMQIHDLM